MRNPSTNWSTYWSIYIWISELSCSRLCA